MADKQEILSVRVPSALAGALRQLADEQGKTVSDVLRDAAIRAVRDAEPCGGLCGLPRTVTGSGFSAPVDVTWKCGCGAPIPATLTIS
jgi:hypothetical protein